MRAKVDPDLCVGSGFCEETCPEVFELTGNVARVRIEVVPPEAQEACRKAAEECPSRAISLAED